MKNWVLHCLIWFGVVGSQEVASSERKDSFDPHKTDNTSQSPRVLSTSWDGCAVGQDGSSAEKKFDVLILGMGLSGMAAATELARNTEYGTGDHLCFGMIEANENYVGGRWQSVKWYAGGLAGHPVGEISFHLYGNTKNVQDTRWDSVERPNDTLTAKERKQYDQDFEKIWMCLHQLTMEYVTGELDHDLSLADAIDECNERSLGLSRPWTASTIYSDPEQYNYVWYNLDFEAADSIFKTGLTLFPLTAYTDQQNKDTFMVDSQRNLVHDNLVQHHIRDEVKMGEVVQEIFWQNNPVKVVTDHQTYYTDKVLLTFSVGVNSYNSFFLNPRSEDVQAKKDAMDRLFGMGEYARIIFQFPTRFWYDREEFLAISPMEPPAFGECNWFQLYDTHYKGDYYHNSKMIVCTLTKHELDKLGDLDENLVNQILKDSLVEMYPFYDLDANPCSEELGIGLDYADPPPANNCRYWIYGDDYSSNPLFRGAYVNTKPYVNPENPGYQAGVLKDVALFEGPLAYAGMNKVYIAGEAACWHLSGWTQAAYYSGIRAVSQSKKFLMLFSKITCLHILPILCELFSS